MLYAVDFAHVTRKLAMLKRTGTSLLLEDLEPWKEVHITYTSFRMHYYLFPSATFPARHVQAASKHARALYPA